jgi:SAM-dependent methyltransferase
MWAAERNNDVTAISYSEADQARARRRAMRIGLEGIRFEVRDLRDLGRHAAELGRYDQVICLEVIEHIADDRKLLRDLAALMCPGGRLLLTTPYLDHVPFFGEVVSGREDGHHVRAGYTHEGMEELLGEAGFRVTSRAFLSGVVSQWLFNLMYRFDAVRPHLGWAVTLPLRVLRPLDGPLTRLIGRPHLAIAVVAERA